MNDISYYTNKYLKIQNRINNLTDRFFQCTHEDEKYNLKVLILRQLNLARKSAQFIHENFRPISIDSDVYLHYKELIETYDNFERSLG